MHPLAAYLDRLHEIHATTRQTPELSYRGALENLLNAVGDTLEPALQATAEPAEEGSGRPDFGVFERRSGNLRCAVEVKPLDVDVPETADGAQVARYWKHYGIVLVTNYRDFLLVARENGGRARVEARFTLAADAEGFWRLSPRGAARNQGEAFVDFLVGVLTRAAPIRRPQELAAELARHAREAKRRIERHDIGVLEPLQSAMEQALGLHFEGLEGTAFFRSSLVQTLFYGLFSGWMLWRQRPGTASVSARHPGVFDWRLASEHLALPLIGDLYEEIARPRRLANLGLAEPLEWATTSLNRVDEEAFFRTFDADHAITLFYEPFLEAFDPALRKSLGVWYTPPEIVQYMVGRVDELLRSDLGVASGLADENVYVLDPACGTGSYIVEVARRIHRTLTEQGHGALAAAGVKKALTTRVFGFEILPAPYVVAHLQLGVLLRSLGTALTADERAEVYLTNALTGWEAPKEPKSQLLFPELAKEAERARRVKSEAPILVILGNPPYNRYAGVAEDEEADLIEPYKSGLYEKWGVRKQLLDDLYIRFYRLAEKRIAEVGGRGIVCFISNYSWLDGVSHPIMRERIVHGFQRIIVDNCNGDKYRTGKRTPAGRPDESMFTTDKHRVGIQVGTAIVSLVCKRAGRNTAKRGARAARVSYRDLWGTGNEKRAMLLSSLKRAARGVPKYVRIKPRATMRWVLVNGDLGKPRAYESWPRLPDLMPVHYSGLNENRQNMLISVDRQTLEERMRRYLNPNVGHDRIAEQYPPLMADAARFDARATRSALLDAGTEFEPGKLVRLAFRPFDDVWLYWMARTKLLNEKREEFFRQAWPGNLFICASQKGRKAGFNAPTVVDKFGDLHLQDPWSQFFPLYVRTPGLLNGDVIEPNIERSVLEGLSPGRRAVFDHAAGKFTDNALKLAESVFLHTLAVFWAPAYREENAGALRQDWPHIPIPASTQVLRDSADLGRRVADLLLPDRPVVGVTTGPLRPDLRDLGTPTKVGGGSIDPRTDLIVDAGWGYRGQKNAVMCGKGRVEPHVPGASAEGQRGRRTAAAATPAVNVYLNARVYWANVPSDAWNMTVGGYPVLKKWLSYREHRVLGRPLTLDEVAYVTEVVRRLQALLLLGPELDANYRACATDTLKFGE